MKNKELKSSFFSTVAGSTLKTLILTLNSFGGIFSKIFKQKYRTGILQISFLERMHFEIYMKQQSFLKNYVTGAPVQSGSKTYFLKSIQFLFFLISKSIRNAFLRLLVRRQDGLYESH